MWVAKGPESFNDIPQPNCNALKDYVMKYKSQKKKAVLMYGPPGTGKTAAVHALAKMNNLELVEINASDYRTADEINKKLGNAVNQMSLFGGSKLIFIDEVDGISGQKDRGGVAAIVKLMDKSIFPIVIAANDVNLDKLKSLKKKCLLLDFPEVSNEGVVKAIKSVLDRSQSGLAESVIKSVARRSGGDLRGAIIDAEVLVHSELNSLEGVHSLSDRSQTESIKQALIKIFKTTDASIALSALDNANENLDEVILWLDENLPKEYSNDSLPLAYNYLSRADVFRGRIRRWQHWRFLVYVSSLITAGIAISKTEKKPGFIEYKRSGRILKMWISNQKLARQRSIAKKLASLCHCSVSKSFSFMPFLKKAMCSDEETHRLLNLDDADVEWLCG